MSEPKKYCSDCRNFLYESKDGIGICMLTNEYHFVFGMCDRWEDLKTEMSSCKLV